MKSNQKIIPIIIILCIIFTLSTCITNHFSDNSINTNKNKEIDEDKSINILKSAKFWPNESPIYIEGTATGVGAHNWTWALSQDWCNFVSGFYVIENVSINAAGSDYGIEIINSNYAYFRIRNCTVYNGEMGGIFLLGVSHGKIEKNYFYNNEDFGIDMVDCKNVTIDGNYIYDNWNDGLVMFMCKNNTILNNKIYNNGDYGIFFNLAALGGSFNLTHNIFLENTIYNNDRGGIKILLSAWGNTKINFSCNIFSKNNITDHRGWTGNGISLWTKVGGDGMVIFNHNEITKNNINDTTDEGIIFEGLLDSTSSSSSRIYCLYNNISENRLIRNGYDGIGIFTETEDENSDGEVYINNNTIERNFISRMEGNAIALYLFLDESAPAKLYCDNNTIKNNTIVNTYEGGNGQAGIYIDSFTNATIVNNKMINCGLFLEKNELNAYLSNRIANNKVNNKPLIYKTNEEYLESTDFSNAGQIILINSNHSVISNLDLSNATVGISLYYCKNFTIYNNTASKGFVGFLLYNSNENNISTNIANDNSWCGIILDSSNNNNITNNDFRRNPSCIVETDCSGNKKANNKCDPTVGVPIPRDNDDDDDDGEPIILGYDVLVLVGIFAIVSVILIKNRRKIN